MTDYSRPPKPKGKRNPPGVRPKPKAAATMPPEDPTAKRQRDHEQQVAATKAREEQRSLDAHRKVRGRKPKVRKVVDVKPNRGKKP